MLILKKYFTLFQDMNCNEKNLDDCFLHLTDYEVSHMSQDKESLWDFPLGQTQTGLYSLRRMLEILDLRRRGIVLSVL